MKLIEYTKTGERSNEYPMISVSKKGNIMLNKKGMELISAKPGDRVVFANDQDKKEDWFIRKGKGEEGARLRKCSGSSGCIMNFSLVVEQIQRTLGVSKTIRMKIFPEKIGDNLYQLNTKEVNRL